MVSQLDAPFSVAASMALFRVGGSFSLISFLLWLLAVFVVCDLCSLLLVVLLLPGVDMILTGSE